MSEIEKKENADENIHQKLFLHPLGEITRYLIKNEPLVNPNMSREDFLKIFHALRKSIEENYCDGWVLLRANEIAREKRKKRKEALKNKEQ